MIRAVEGCPGWRWANEGDATIYAIASPEMRHNHGLVGVFMLPITRTATRDASNIPGEPRLAVFYGDDPRLDDVSRARVVDWMQKQEARRRK